MAEENKDKKPEGEALSGEWDAVAAEGFGETEGEDPFSEEAPASRMLNQDEIDSLLGFNEEAVEQSAQTGIRTSADVGNCV